MDAARMHPSLYRHVDKTGAAAAAPTTKPRDEDGGRGGDGLPPLK
jgi:hypothetical protein